MDFSGLYSATSQTRCGAGSSAACKSSIFPVSEGSGGEKDGKMKRQLGCVPRPVNSVRFAHC